MTSKSFLGRLVNAFGLATVLLGLSSNAAMAQDTGWVQWPVSQGGNDHYYRMPAGNMGWDQAKAAAIAAGGYLVTIASSAENEFVRQMLGSTNAWIGLYQPLGSPEPAGGWTWVSGEPLVFTNWQPSEPNNGSTQEDYVTMLPTGKWNDDPLSSPYRFVIERVQNTPPDLQPIPNQVVNELSLLTFTAVGSDSDIPAQTLTYSLVGAPIGASINASTGVFSWTPTEAQGPGTYTFSVRVSDFVAFAEQTVNVTVNEVNIAPNWSSIPAQPATEFIPFAFDVASFASDIDTLPILHNNLTFSKVGGPDDLTVSPSGTVNWTTDETDGGTARTVTVRVTDDGAPSLFADATFAINVAESNSTPLLMPIPNQTVNELSTLTFTAVGLDTDEPDQTLTYSLVGAPAGAGIGAFSGLFSWTPTEAQGPGAFTFKVRVSDNGVPTHYRERTVTITVNEVNTAPNWNSIPGQSASEFTTFSLNVAPYASDTDTLPTLPNHLTFSKVDGPNDLTVSGAGMVSWTPGELDGGIAHTVTVRVTDDGAPSLFADAIFTINVAEVNAAPTWSSIPNQSASEGVAFSMSLTSFVSDSDDPAQSLTYSVVDGPSGLTVSPAGVVNWTPGELDGGTTQTVTVRVTDSGSPIRSAESSFGIVIGDTNQPPSWTVIPLQTATVSEPFSLNLAPFASDLDIPANTLTFSLVGGPVGLTVSPSGVVNWVPGASVGGSSQIVTVRVSDGTASADTTLTIANWVRWSVNGSFYTVVLVPERISWPAAKSMAEGMGGYLATLTSSAENDFVFSLVDNASYWRSRGSSPGDYQDGPWFGLRQAAGSLEPLGGWGWVTGEPLGFVNWLPNEPNDYGNENSGEFTSIGPGTRSNRWNDVKENDSTFNPIAFVVEKSRTVIGRIHLSDVVADPVGTRTISVRVRQNNVTVATLNVPVGNSAPFAIPIPLAGPATLLVNGPTQLRRVIDVSAIAGPTQVGDIFLFNGDVNDDGEVDAADIDEAIAEFGSMLFGPADIDMSGEVDAADIDIVIANFGRVDE